MNNLAGGQASPSDPWAPNLTPGGRLSSWSEDDFMAVFREGVTADGRQLSEAMPWDSYEGITDDELSAMWLYLSSMEALPDNEQ